MPNMRSTPDIVIGLLARSADDLTSIDVIAGPDPIVPEATSSTCRILAVAA